MRLAAVYINDHFLFDQPQILNFGGRFIYEFESIDDRTIVVIFKENASFMEGFWGTGISSLSAVVGANGAGKTSILKVINKGYQEFTKSIFIYEGMDGHFFLDNRTGDRNESGQFIEGTGLRVYFAPGIKYSKYKPDGFTELYFSPIFDPKIEDFFSHLGLNSSHPEKILDEIFMENIRKDVIFLNADISKTIKQAYADFPTYENLHIIPKKLYKRDFRKVYNDTNLGNPKKNETLVDTIERDLRVKNYTNTESLLNSYLDILKSSNIVDALNEIWDIPSYRNNSEHDQHLVHSSGDFIKDIEINILSFLVINDTFAITDLTGSFNFERILNSKSFDELLNQFLVKYIVQIDKNFYRYEDKIRIDNYTELVDIVMKEYGQFVQLSGVKTESLKSNIMHHINGFMALKSLHDIFVALSDDIVFENGRSILKIDVNREDIEDLTKALFDVYSKVREYFSNIPIALKDIIDIESNKNLSYGEKSILNLYSTFHDFTLTNNHVRESENFLLILDEADLGYHPIWKRKFINTLCETLPIIFAQLKPYVWDSVVKRKKPSDNESPILQIVIATHDPLTLSDFPSSNIIYLKKDSNRKTVILNSEIDTKKSFGANITDLLADSFFVEDGLIGDFARKKIEQTIMWLNEQKKKKEELGSSYIIKQGEIEHQQSIIKIIDEPVIKIKLAEMLDELNDQTDVQKEIIQREIDLLNEKLGKL
ncbi:OLD family protein [Flavobacterium panici]|uniref:ATPase AAA-type core domain-containing protein n=1 Tax=Flavobacterium panici TaxID=2654843 RepID=A0A9N8J1C1_9FLAO|nr:hypothetical protein [Flavobacterium panici]CAC9974435.1 hypothetical protein FLAPXU55_02132 [Flavobacterium panici]